MDGYAGNSSNSNRTGGAAGSSQMNHPHHSQERSLSGRNLSNGSELAKIMGGTYFELGPVSATPNQVDRTVDEVFIQDTPPASLSGGLGARFPPAYNISRAVKNEKLMATRLGTLDGHHRIAEEIGFPRGGLAVEDDTRHFSSQNYHCVEKGLNLSLSVARPTGPNNDPLSCLSCSSHHSIASKLKNNLPITVVLSDQNFPAILPAENDECVVIIRVEDGLLSELENAFTDRFKAHLHPHGRLSSGSLILVGSLAHLQARGLADYAECLVSTLASLKSRAGPGVKSAPLVNIPLQGIEKRATIRALFDLDCWLVNMPAFGTNSFPATRRLFWGAVGRGGSGEVAQESDGYTVMMPISLTNKRKVPVTSEPVAGTLPNHILPVPPPLERELIHELLKEVNSAFGLTLDTMPDTARGIAPPPSLDERRMVIVGASHMSRIADTMVVRGENAESISTPGWVPTSENIEKAASYVAGLKLSNKDKLVIDLWSNSAYLGTDELGLPSKPFKGVLDGKYHILGQLQSAPKPVYQKILKDSSDLLSAAGEAEVLFVLPLPRYISAKCCSDSSHLTNFGEDDLICEMLRAEEIVTSLVYSLGNPRYKVFSFIEKYGIDKDPSSMVTMGGLPVWAEGDGVHLSETAYEEMGSLLAASEEPSESLTGKRPRLESVVPGRVAKRHRGGTINPSPWVMGNTPSETPRGGGRGRSWYGGRGGIRGRGGRALRGAGPSYRAGWRGSRGRAGRRP